MSVKFAAAVVLAIALPASAATTKIATLYSTGTDANHAATTGNGTDEHWTLTGGTPYTGGTNGTWPISPWVSDTATARWITPTANAADNAPVGQYRFETEFLLGTFTAARLIGKFAVDNSITAIRLNGETLPISGGSFTGYDAFEYNGRAFQTGINRLSIDVFNGGGPTGLQLDIAGETIVPEPATWGMMIVGFMMTGISARRRASTVAS